MNNRVLVLGASGDIGMAVVKKLVRQGWCVYAHYHKNEQRITSAIEEFGKPDDIIPVQADLASSQSVDQMLKQLNDVHSIVHAGGKTFEGLFEETPDAVMKELWSTHVFQPARIIRELIPGMRRSKTGSIVFVSSIWGETGASYEVIYSAVKGAQQSFVKALGKELAPSNVRVNAVSPGAVDTSMTAHYSELDRLSIEEGIPMGRMALTDEIAGAVAFLLGNDASYITSHVLSVNGGWHA